MNPSAFALNFLGSLGVFLYGLKVMSEGLQKAAGPRLRAILSKATVNPAVGTLSGFLVTCAVQSSSATTVMVVGFCSAGLLTFHQSLGVIFGANIGTTTTAWLVSLLGFKVKITAFALPMIGLGFFSQFIRRWRTPHRIGEAMLGFGLLFLGLDLLKDSIPDIRQAPEVYAWLARFHAVELGPRLLAVLLGTGLTVVFQSSSAMMAVTLTAAAKGLIDYPTAAALVLGENIGTTVTANLAAIGAPLAARRAARAHFFFNVFGVLWAVALFDPFLRLINATLPGDPMASGEEALLVHIPLHLSAFHSVFNVINTLLFLPSSRLLERFIVWLEPGTKRELEEHELVYLSTPLTATPELAITAAQKEVDRMAEVTVGMADKIKAALAAKKKELPQVLQSIRDDERKTDVLEHKINEYLGRLVHSHLSSSAHKEVISLLSMINDLERIGDHGEKIAVLLERHENDPYTFSPAAMKELGAMTDKAKEILQATRALILRREEAPLPAALKRENELNDLRDRFRQAHLKRLAERKCSPLAGIVFTDLLTSFEKMGDHAFNVVEATVGLK